MVRQVCVYSYPEMKSSEFEKKTLFLCPLLAFSLKINF